MFNKSKFIYFCYIVMFLIVGAINSNLYSALMTVSRDIETGPRHSTLALSEPQHRVTLDSTMGAHANLEISNHTCLKACCLCCAGGYGLVTFGLIGGALSAPAILAYLSDRSDSLALASGVVNSIYIFSLCNNQNEKYKNITAISRVINGPLLITATAYSWLYYQYGDDYYRNVNCGTTVAYAVASFSLATFAVCFLVATSNESPNRASQV